MATPVEHRAFTRPQAYSLSRLGAQLGAAWRRLGVVGRRAAVTAVGAVFALICGVAVADVVRLPADMQRSAQPDEMTVQTELPSAAAARAYALENPPTYAVATKTDADPALDTTPVIATDDVSLTRTAYTGASDDDQGKVDQADQSRDRSTAAPGATPDAN